MDFHQRPLKRRRRLGQPTEQPGTQAASSLPGDDTTQATTAQEEVINCYWCLEGRPASQCCAVNKACYECIRGCFERTVQSEEHYPLKWPGIQLKVEDYVHILPQELVRRFKEKEKEYLTPVDERIYCRKKPIQSATRNLLARMPVQGIARPSLRDSSSEECGGFVGRTNTLSIDGNNTSVNEKDVQARCKSCRTTHCLVCGEAYVNGGHQCDGIPPAREVDEALVGVPGKDFQYCPSTFCRRKIQLMDGCNHMHCKCGQSFCYICGKPVDVRETKHWGKGGCPRFNHPDAPNANWDDAGMAIHEGLAFEHADEHVIRQFDNWRQQQQQLRAMRERESPQQLEQRAQIASDVEHLQQQQQQLRQQLISLQHQPRLGRGRRNAIAPDLPSAGRADAPLPQQTPTTHAYRHELQRGRGGRLHAARSAETHDNSDAFVLGPQAETGQFRTGQEEQTIPALGPKILSQARSNAASRLPQPLQTPRGLQPWLWPTELDGSQHMVRPEQLLTPRPILTPQPRTTNVYATRRARGDGPPNHRSHRGMAQMFPSRIRDPPPTPTEPTFPSLGARSHEPSALRRHLETPYRVHDPSRYGHVTQRAQTISLDEWQARSNTLRSELNNNHQYLRRRPRGHQPPTTSTLPSPGQSSYETAPFQGMLSSAPDQIPAFRPALQYNPASPFGNTWPTMQAAGHQPVQVGLQQFTAAQASTQGGAEVPQATSQGSPADGDVEMTDFTWEDELGT